MKSLLLASIILLVMVPAQGQAHETRFTGIDLNFNTPGVARLAVEIDLLDLELAVAIDDNLDGSIHWYEYQNNRADIVSYIMHSLTISANDEACDFDPMPSQGGLRTGQSPSVVTVFAIECSNPAGLFEFENRLLTGIDPDAAAMLSISGAGAKKTILLEQGRQFVEIADTGFIRANVTFFQEGIRHILIGFDHLVFLLLLILPAASNGNWRERASAVAGIVTAFTLAHSVTLALSATGLLTLPSQAVEIVIATSVILAGMINLVKPTHRMGWLLAYAFGLVHGFGFASALAELAIADGLELLNLAAFNIGVEVGQIVLVALALPLLFFIAKNASRYRQISGLLSVSATALGAFWLLERVA